MYLPVLRHLQEKALTVLDNMEKSGAVQGFIWGDRIKMQRNRYRSKDRDAVLGIRLAVSGRMHYKRNEFEYAC